MPGPTSHLRQPPDHAVSLAPPFRKRLESPLGMAATSKRNWVLTILCLVVFFCLPTVYRYWQIYDPWNSLFGSLPPGLMGRLVFYDPGAKAYRALTLPELLESSMEISGNTVDLTFSADGRFAVYRLGRASYLFDSATGSERRLKAPYDAHFLTISPNGHGIAYMSYRKGRYALVVSPGPIRPRLAHKRIALNMLPERLAWAHDDSHIYVTTSDNTIATYDIKRAQLSKMFPGRYPSRSPRGRFLAFYRREGKRFKLVFLDTTTAKEHLVGTCPAIRPVVWSPDERFILYFEPVKSFMWRSGQPAIRLRLYDVFKKGFNTVLRGRNLGLPERLLWIP